MSLAITVEPWYNRLYNLYNKESRYNETLL